MVWKGISKNTKRTIGEPKITGTYQVQYEASRTLYMASHLELAVEAHWWAEGANQDIQLTQENSYCNLMQLYIRRDNDLIKLIKEHTKQTSKLYQD